jgi:ligand-binding sensor protein
MQLTDIMPVEDWIEVENEIVERTGLCAAVMDVENKRITDNVRWANELCPKIKGDPQGLAQICSVAQGAMAKEARESGEPVVRECDAGMLKITVPVFSDGEFLGTAGGCGLLPPGGGLDAFYISKATGMSEEEIEKYEVGVLSLEKAEETARWLDERIKKAVRG